MAMRIVAWAALAAGIVSAQGPSDGIAGCTARSFAIPSWLVRDVKIANGVTSFNLQNRATNYTANLACETTKTGLNLCAIQGTPSGNSTLQAAVEISSKPRAFYLKQSWTCDDRGKVLTFTASGNNSLPFANYTSPLLVKGSLSEPVTIVPVYADGPEGHDSPGCSAKSENPTWVLTSIHYTDEPGDGVSSNPFRNFNLVVTNQANGYQASCMPAGAFGDSPNLARLNCAGWEFQSFSIGQYPITSQASFDPETATFTLNQTWYCDDTDPAKPLRINAAGTISLPLTCTEEQSTSNSNLTNRYCSTTPATLTLEGELGTVVTLPPYVLEDPSPSQHGDGCTLTSIFNPRWQFSQFSVEEGKVYFEVILMAQDRGFQYPIPVYQGKDLEGGWVECEIGEDGGNGLPLWPYLCKFKYDAETQSLELDAKWECTDLDASNPIDFHGVSTAVVNSTEPGYTFTAPIAYVSWGPWLRS